MALAQGNAQSQLLTVEEMWNISTTHLNKAVFGDRSNLDKLVNHFLEVGFTPPAEDEA